MLLPNPYAAPAYTKRQLPVGREWRLERSAGTERGVYVRVGILRSLFSDKFYIALDAVCVAPGLQDFCIFN
jgi:hypothetical protein